MKIIPAVIGESFLDIENKLSQVEGAADWAQIDIVDGEFAHPKSWPYTEAMEPEDVIKDLHDLKTPLNIELHLMIARPEDTLDEWIDTPAKRVIFHFEATKHFEENLTVLDMSTTECGVALNLDTPFEDIEDYLDKIDLVQFMSIRQIGSYGAAFENEVLEKISAFHKKYPKMPINVDGGLSEKTISLIKKVGAMNAIVGSGIFKSSDAKQAIEHLKKM